LGVRAGSSGDDGVQAADIPQARKKWQVKCVSLRSIKKKVAVLQEQYRKRITRTFKLREMITPSLAANIFITELKRLCHSFGEEADCATGEKRQELINQYNVCAREVNKRSGREVMVVKTVNELIHAI
jgi:hypothetical protein